MSVIVKGIFQRSNALDLGGYTSCLSVDSEFSRGQVGVATVAEIVEATLALPSRYAPAPYSATARRLHCASQPIAADYLRIFFQKLHESTEEARDTVNLAVDLLLGTDLLVKQVAERAGFDDPFHFSRVFKRLQGISPAAFQRMHKRTAVG